MWQSLRRNKSKVETKWSPLLIYKEEHSKFIHRHLNKMKSRTQFFTVFSLLILILGIAWFTLASRNQEPIPVFPATINRDCAPWDGAAFTILIRYDPITTITISIWKSPDLNFPSTFSFPDETGQVGYAYILPELDPLQQLSGEVFFWRVNEERPVEGEFDLVTGEGQQFKGQFKAEWGNEIVYCGCHFTHSFAATGSIVLPQFTRAGWSKSRK